MPVAGPLLPSAGYASPEREGRGPQGRSRAVSDPLLHEPVARVTDSLKGPLVSRKCHHLSSTGAKFLTLSLLRVARVIM